LPAAREPGLTQGTDGNFYGVKPGGVNDYGVIFQATPGGAVTPLYFFNNTDGALPSGCWFWARTEVFTGPRGKEETWAASVTTAVAQFFE
jgi:hypothetical protein